MLLLLSRTNWILLILFLLVIPVYLIATAGLKQRKKALAQKFPEEWKNFLTSKVPFYRNLSNEDKKSFEKRIKLFLATKKIEGVNTEVDDHLKLLVASSAIIPMFAFPKYNYPTLDEVLIYPNRFDHEFNTDSATKSNKNISGMVGNRYMNRSMILSKPDLVKAYDGRPHEQNVGVHEFVHLVDKTDGDTDGVPEILLDHSYTAPWLKAVHKEMVEIQKGHSDIRPYALTNNAEFLAVASEYFFDNPEKFSTKHPKMYEYLSEIFHTKEASS